jgi:hypothetical protein
MSKSRIARQREQEQMERRWREFTQALPAGHGIDELCTLLERMPHDQLLSLQAYLRERLLAEEEVAPILAPLEREQAEREEAHRLARPKSPSDPNDSATIAWLEESEQISRDRIQRELRHALPPIVLECIDEVLSTAEATASDQGDPTGARQSGTTSSSSPANLLFHDLRDRPDILEYFQSFDQDEQGLLIWDDEKGKREDLAHMLDCLYGSVDGYPPIIRHDKQRFTRAVLRFTYPDRPINAKTLSNQATELRNAKRSPSDQVAMMIQRWRK